MDSRSLQIIKYVLEKQTPFESYGISFEISENGEKKIANVRKDSVSYRAGLKPGCIVNYVNDINIKDLDYESLVNLMALYPMKLILSIQIHENTYDPDDPIHIINKDKYEKFASNRDLSAKMFTKSNENVDIFLDALISKSKRLLNHNSEKGSHLILDTRKPDQTTNLFTKSNVKDHVFLDAHVSNYKKSSNLNPEKSNLMNLETKKQDLTENLFTKSNEKEDILLNAQFSNLKKLFNLNSENSSLLNQEAIKQLEMIPPNVLEQLLMKLPQPPSDVIEKPKKNYRNDQSDKVPEGKKDYFPSIDCRNNESNAEISEKEVFLQESRLVDYDDSNSSEEIEKLNDSYSSSPCASSKYSDDPRFQKIMANLNELNSNQLDEVLKSLQAQLDDDPLKQLIEQEVKRIKSIKSQNKEDLSKHLPIQSPVIRNPNHTQDSSSRKNFGENAEEDGHMRNDFYRKELHRIAHKSRRKINEDSPIHEHKSKRSKIDSNVQDSYKFDQSKKGYKDSNSSSFGKTEVIKYSDISSKLKALKKRHRLHRSKNYKGYGVGILTQGCFIHTIEVIGKNSPASLAKLMPGSIILKINEQCVHTLDHDRIVSIVHNSENVCDITTIPKEYLDDYKRLFVKNNDTSKIDSKSKLEKSSSSNTSISSRKYL